MEHIGEILRTAREDNFYTQKKVMELTGINRKTLSGYENSVAEPDLDTFARLLRLYQLSADEVLGIKTSTPPPSHFSLSRCERKMLTPVSYTHLDVYKRQERRTCIYLP